MCVQIFMGACQYFFMHIDSHECGYIYIFVHVCVGVIGLWLLWKHKANVLFVHHDPLEFSPLSLKRFPQPRRRVFIRDMFVCMYVYTSMWRGNSLHLLDLPLCETLCVHMRLRDFAYTPPSKRMQLLCCSNHHCTGHSYGAVVTVCVCVCVFALPSPSSFETTLCSFYVPFLGKGFQSLRYFVPSLLKYPHSACGAACGLCGNSHSSAT